MEGFYHISYQHVFTKTKFQFIWEDVAQQSKELLTFMWYIGELCLKKSIIEVYTSTMCYVI